MVKLKIADVYVGNPAVVAPAVAALQDVLRQRMGRELGKRLRSMERAFTQQIEEAQKEHQRIIDLYSPKDADGNGLPIQQEDDLTDKAAFRADYDALLLDTFEVEGIPEELIEGMQLAGATWASPLIVDEPAKKNDSGGSAGG